MRGQGEGGGCQEHSRDCRLLGSKQGEKVSCMLDWERKHAASRLPCKNPRNFKLTAAPRRGIALKAWENVQNSVFFTYSEKPGDPNAVIISIKPDSNKI